MNDCCSAYKISFVHFVSNPNSPISDNHTASARRLNGNPPDGNSRVGN